jgi:hypothetical protein
MVRPMPDLDKLAARPCEASPQLYFHLVVLELQSHRIPSIWKNKDKQYHFLGYDTV